VDEFIEMGKESAVDFLTKTDNIAGLLLVRMDNPRASFELGYPAYQARILVSPVLVKIAHGRILPSS
jgi:hypothetical protein